MLKNLLHPFGIYRLNAKMQMLQSRIKRIESRKYINLQTRMELSHLKKMLMSLDEQELAIHRSELMISGFEKH